MRLKDKLKAAGEIIKVRAFKRKVPVAVTWPVTNRCNLQCKYCDRWQRNSREPSTKDALAILSQLTKLGCVKISFSGGEPLLRKDIGILINYCKEKHISSTVISNGLLVPERIKELNNVDLLELSLDGAEQINDFIRGEGTYRRVLEAAKAAEDAGIKIIFNMVLTKYNLDSIDSLLDIAIRFNTGVMFGPVSHLHSADKLINFLFPEKEKFSQTIDQLIDEKGKGGPILNSISALKYMKGWPNPQKIPCYAGKAFCHIGADGKLYPCVALEQKVDAQDCLDGNFQRLLNYLPSHIFCSGCWCMGTLEFNRFLALKPSTISALRKLG